MAAVTGTEIVYVLGQNPTSVNAAAEFPTTTAQIAQLAGNITGYKGTFTLTGTTPVTVTNANVAITSTIPISLNTVGGTVGAVPAIKTITAATGFTVAGTAGDTSIYNYSIL